MNSSCSPPLGPFVVPHRPGHPAHIAEPVPTLAVQREAAPAPAVPQRIGTAGPLPQQLQVHDIVLAALGAAHRHPHALLDQPIKRFHPVRRKWRVLSHSGTKAERQRFGKPPIHSPALPHCTPSASDSRQKVARATFKPSHRAFPRGVDARISAP